MNVKATNVRPKIKATVRVALQGVPDTKVPYISRDIQPDYAEIDYGFSLGWWVAQQIAVSGYRILKPGPDGQRRIGKERHELYWYVGVTGDVQQDRDLPEWLDDLVTRLRPSGQVLLPSGDE